MGKTSSGTKSSSITTDQYVIASRSDLIGVADAIRAKGGTSDALAFPGGFVDAVGAISAGSARPDVKENDVNLYDYDGTLLHSYTLGEVRALDALPGGAWHDGLVFDGWNWSLEDIKAVNSPLTVGAMYKTDDGTTRVYISLVEGRTSPMLGVGVNGTVTVDWGDGSAQETLTGTDASVAVWTQNHAYPSPGDYVIRLSVDGELRLVTNNAANNHICLLRHAETADARNTAYKNAITRIDIGSSVTQLPERLFDSCYGLKTIIVPRGIGYIGNNAFVDCRAMLFICLPDSIEPYQPSVFSFCVGLRQAALPKVDSTPGGTGVFNGCSALSVFTMPASPRANMFNACPNLNRVYLLPGVTALNNSTFANTYSLTYVSIPDSVTEIAFAFPNCTALAVLDCRACSDVPAMTGTGVFATAPDDFRILVPAALEAEWKAATNWSEYADRIIGV